ncbi:DUF4919 domain-containing protein [Chryseobacterium sp. PMSZPI]|uniref:DUF4919 domain-containing protein n=1 Tax=Chryseobacterium sp. PMSZPI TaxID=1033900 RepID=UPI000C326563|nr:DUF4919 domain-containing protein [Chryseobacterium sp. PMSZPI]PKF74545.1 hypothetical protein CW752_08790 [Chryseobacterium sp. PMSZPI]
MRKHIISGILILIFQVFYAQIDTDLIKRNVTENPKENYFPLLEKFKINPNSLSQEELNQLYYGSKFIKSDYSIGDYNTDYDKIWKQTQKKLSKVKAEKIIAEAEVRYKKNPLNKFVLEGMVYLYSTIEDEKKLNIVEQQLDLIKKTIEKSGDGKSEQSPICVIDPGDVLVQLDKFSFIDRTKFGQKTRQLEDGSILSMYTMGDEVYYVKLVGGYY